jgi:biopolymer transport protein TolQ
MFHVEIARGQGINIMEVIINGGIVAKTVLLILGWFSTINWIVIFQKTIVLSRSRIATNKFRIAFNQAADWMELKAASSRFKSSPLLGLFVAGYSEVAYQLRPRPGVKAQIKSVEAIERSLQRAAIAEMGRMESGLGTLATIAAVSPFIGLFGTVWGIMDAFRGIGTTGNTSLATVAPGISEALIATAIGLVAAIPALMAYNFFQGKMKRLKSELNDFALEFVSLSERNFT